MILSFPAVFSTRTFWGVWKKARNSCKSRWCEFNFPGGKEGFIWCRISIFVVSEVGTLRSIRKPHNFVTVFTSHRDICVVSMLPCYFVKINNTYVDFMGLEEPTSYGKRIGRRDLALNLFCNALFFLHEYTDGQSTAGQNNLR